MWDERSVSGNECILARRMCSKNKLVPNAEMKVVQTGQTRFSPRVNFTSQKRNPIFVNTSFITPPYVYVGGMVALN